MTQNSPNLEVVSRQSNERRRVARWNLTHQQFRLEESGKILPVFDLSEEGMGLRVLENEDLFLFPLGRTISGALNLKREKFQVDARVVRMGSDIVGCEFVNLSPEIQSALKSFFDPKTLGSELRAVETEEGGPLWFHGRSGSDLLIWRGLDGQVNRLALYFMGSFVQWEEAPGLATGRIDSSTERPEFWGEFRSETLLLQPDSELDLSKLKIAKTLILSSNLSQDLKKNCVRPLDVMGDSSDGQKLRT